MHWSHTWTQSAIGTAYHITSNPLPATSQVSFVDGKRAHNINILMGGKIKVCRRDDVIYACMRLLSHPCPCMHSMLHLLLTSANNAA